MRGGVGNENVSGELKESQCTVWWKVKIEVYIYILYVQILCSCTSAAKKGADSWSRSVSTWEGEENWDKRVWFFETPWIWFLFGKHTMMCVCEFVGMYMDDMFLFRMNAFGTYIYFFFGISTVYCLMMIMSDCNLCFRCKLPVSLAVPRFCGVNVVTVETFRIGDKTVHVKLQCLLYYANALCFFILSFFQCIASRAGPLWKNDRQVWSFCSIVRCLRNPVLPPFTRQQVRRIKPCFHELYN